MDVDDERQSHVLPLVRFPSRSRGRTEAALPLDVDLEPGGTIDVEVWLDYADGLSHWVYRDLSYDCTIPERGDFQATIAGGVNRRVVRGANSTAGLDPWPMGGQVLHISNRFESDFDFGVVLGGTPETVATFEISDESMLPPISFSGGIDYETGDDKASWFIGDATVRFEKVTPDGACGTLTGEIVGMMPGTMAPRELPVTIDARFWAESRD